MGQEVRDMSRKGALSGWATWTYWWGCGVEVVRSGRVGVRRRERRPIDAHKVLGELRRAMVVGGVCEVHCECAVVSW